MDKRGFQVYCLAATLAFYFFNQTVSEDFISGSWFVERLVSTWILQISPYLFGIWEKGNRKVWVDYRSPKGYLANHQMQSVV